MDDLGSRKACDGPMQLVLYRGKEVAGYRSRAIIVDGQGVDIGNLLIESSLTSANLSNAFKKFIEIVLAKVANFFEAIVVDREALD